MKRILRYAAPKRRLGGLPQWRTCLGGARGLSSRSKEDPKLGWEVRRHLESLGLETPTIIETLQNGDAEKAREIEDCVRRMMTVMGLDLTNDSLEDTPRRVAKMYTEEMFWGLDPNRFPRCTVVENSMRVVMSARVRRVHNCVNPKPRAGTPTRMRARMRA